jgi:DNA-binding CsgD family transcriptional regulator
MTCIPPFFTNQSQEYFVIEESINRMTNGHIEQVTSLPIEFYELLLKELSNDKEAQEGLNKMGVTNEKDRIYQYFKCNYSAYDSIPDIDATGQLGAKEYVSCSRRENCPGEGLACKAPSALSRRQIQIVKRIGAGQMDAEICSDLKISIHTLRNHKNNIEKKIGRTGKIAIAVWSVEQKIVN